ncbi:histidine kinase dimerization/phospho-acceptor domain-containing protein, partial [Arthrospira platensis SPKY1]|nr:histidine kinase dimerization/phospho-acceptor domain-containing protein [Arthrospira platensis SPKY1]
SDWSDVARTPLVTVLAPYYLQWWFMLLMGLVVALAGYLVFRLVYLRRQESVLAREVSLRTQQLQASEQQLQRQNRELTEINKSLDQFTAAVSHDLKSPLNSSIGLLDLLDDSYTQNELLKFIGMVKKNLEKMRALMGELIELSRNSNQALVVEEIDLKQLVL